MSTITPAQYGLNLKSRYDNFIGGRWLPPVNGRYFENLTPVTGKALCEIARSDEADIELALDAAHAAKAAWGKTSVAQRSLILLRIADRMEQHLHTLATVETFDNGKPIRETLAADIPLAIDHFRYFAGCIRAQEGSLGEIDATTVAYHFHEPLGVVGQIIPWNFPILMAAWKLAPALAAGNCVVLKPAEQTPLSILIFAELVGDLLPPGVLNIVNGFGTEAGKALATSKRIAKIAFTGSTPVGRLIMNYASQNLIPVTLELGGKSPVLIAPGADLQHAACRIVAGKLLNAGQTCVAPDYVLVPRQQQAALVAALRDAATRAYPSLAGNADYSAIISVPHHQRLQALAAQAQAAGAVLTTINPANETAAALAAARKRLEHVANVSFSEADMHALPLPSASYDQVFLMHALAYTREPKKVLQEAARGLRPLI